MKVVGICGCVDEECSMVLAFRREERCKGVDCLHYITCCIYCIVGLSMAGIV